MKAPRPTPTAIERLTVWVGSPSSVIAHTAFFISAFLMGTLGFAEWGMVLLVLTTVVSLEAIYLAIFIQMTVNRQGRELAEVSEDIDEIQEDIDEIQEDVEEISEDVEEISEDVEDIQEDVEELSDDDAPPAAEGVVVDARPGIDQVLAELKAIRAELETLKSKPADAPPRAPRDKSVKPEKQTALKKLARTLSPKKKKDTV